MRLLTERKNSIVSAWFSRTLQTYPETMNRFLSQEKDPFLNPVGHAYGQGLAALFDGLLATADLKAVAPVVDKIIRIRAVQDFSPGQAVAFMFLLKQVLRELLASQCLLPSPEFTALEDRIDNLALLAFDAFMRCREELYAIRVRESRRTVFQMDRLRPIRSSTSNT
jgi:hypothetical protein